MKISLSVISINIIRPESGKKAQKAWRLVGKNNKMYGDMGSGHGPQGEQQRNKVR